MVGNSDVTVAGTSWIVVELAGRATSEPRPQLTFGEGGRVGGSTGVNRLGGRYAVADGVLTVTDTVMTRMAGPPDAMDQEQRLLEVLGEPRQLTAGEGELILGGPAADAPAPDESAPDGSAPDGSAPVEPAPEQPIAAAARLAPAPAPAPDPTSAPAPAL
ncbi:META domain-containing protein [Terrabacter sp. NPDC000476]|uniref:META domain-containing protein n=1 Tax=Terrabacter sp. NPDC000476 TaxID=3154258 RepID=UPI00332E2A9B